MSLQYSAKMQDWVDRCQPFLTIPESVPVCEQMIRQNNDLEKQYLTVFESLKRHGHAMTKIMKEPVTLTTEGLLYW